MGHGRETPRYRRFGQVVLDKVTRLGLSGDVNVTDTQSGFRAFSMKAADVFKFGTGQLGIDSEMLMDAAKAELRITEVDIGVRYDVGHSSQHPIAHGLQVLGGVLRNIEFKKPLLAFTAPGLHIHWHWRRPGRVLQCKDSTTGGAFPTGPRSLCSFS